MPRQIGYVIGSLRKESINRKLANALIKLAPPDFTFKELQDRRSAAVQPGRRQGAGAGSAEAQERAARGGCRDVRDRRIQPLDSGRAQERARPCLAALWAERLGRQTGGHHRRIDRRHRHRPSRNCTCAPSWPISTCPRSDSPRPTCRSRTASSTKPATSPIAETRKFLHGWMDKYVAWVKRLTG